MESFRKLGLSEQILKLLKIAGFSKPSEIQEKVIPLVLAGKDVIGGSATGSGKTLAFGTGILEKIQKEKGSQVLILTPTRELAEQVGNVFIRFGSYKRLNVAIVYGGVNINPQIRDLRSSEIIVGTPGRILDHLQRGTINLTSLKVLILDEADRMMDMGFIHDVEKIIRNCPKERQTLLFSATISADVEHVAEKHMKNPVRVSAESYITPGKLKQIYYDVPKNLKFSLLVHLLKREVYGLGMVFCNPRHNTNFVANNLKNLSIDAMAIHGGLLQKKRTSVMEKFTERKVYVLVCTDIAARGLDIKGISHVYNYDIPKTSKDYIHRIGRTARAGKEGIAINLLSERDYDNFRNVLKDGSLIIEKEEVPRIEMVRMMINKPFEHGKERWDSENWQARKQKGTRHKERTSSKEDRDSRKKKYFHDKRNFRRKGTRGGSDSGRGNKRVSSQGSNYRPRNRRQWRRR